MRNEDEINEQADKASESRGQSKWPGMTYEQGVENALRWVVGDEETGPMDEDG